MIETWETLPGYEGAYEVSDLGNVRSLDRMVNGPHGLQRANGRQLRPATNKEGRRYVCLSLDGRSICKLVAPLVLKAHVGPRPLGMQACHNDGDAANDVLTNLRWDTQSANEQDKIRHGGHNNARKTHCIRGHKLSGPNLVQQKVGRRCRTCYNATQSARRKADRVRKRADA